MSVRILLFCACLLLWRGASAIDEVFQTEEGALRGYDVVAYHEEGRPVPGTAEFTHVWNGATWRFSNADHRDRFAADPERFAPQYGGYCAYGTSRGYKVSTQPDAFAVIDGKLYLNYSKGVQQTWSKDPANFIRIADTEWLKLEHEAYTRGD